MKNQAKVCISIHWLGVYVHVPYNQTLQLINGCKSYHKPSAIWTTDHRNYLWISLVRFLEKNNYLQYQLSSNSSLAQITLCSYSNGDTAGHDYPRCKELKNLQLLINNTTL
jgi:hypothetical protein